MANHGQILFLSLMNLIGKVQNEWEQLWRHVIRPARTVYPEGALGPPRFKLKGREIHRKDFYLDNRRGLTFGCSLWTPVEGKYPCVVYMHGNSSNRTEGVEYLGKLLANNIAMCCFDFSGCGNAEGEYVSLGVHEQDDLEAVLAYLTQFPSITEVALWGRSMGAVTALLYLPGCDFIKAVVVDSPFLSFKQLVEDMCRKTTKIPSFVLSPAFRLLKSTIKEKAQFSLSDLNPMKAVPHLKVPAMFVVGVEDEVIPIEHTMQLFEAYPGEDKVIKMVLGGHNDNRPD